MPARHQIIAELLTLQLDKMGPHDHIVIFDALSETLPDAAARSDCSEIAQKFRDALKLESRVLVHIDAEIKKAARIRSSKPGHN